MLKSRVLILIVFSLIVLGVIFYFVSPTYTIRLARQSFDTVAYTEEDYELMRAYFNSDTVFQRMLNENIEAGDIASVHTKEFLSTSYQFRDTTQVEEWQVKAMVQAYRVSTDVLNKFADIKNRLKELEEASAEDSTAKQELDSLRDLAKQGKLPKEFKSPLDPKQ